MIELNMLHHNRTTIPVSISPNAIESIKPFLIDHSGGVEGCQIKMTSGDMFAVVESYAKVRALMGGEQMITEVAPAPVQENVNVKEEVNAAKPGPVTSAAIRG